MKISSTKDYLTHGVKVLVYSEAGVGKTVLCSTAPKPIILSAESGLLSLAHLDLPVIEITSLADLIEVYKWLLKSKEANKYYTVCIDSLSDIAEVVLSNHMVDVKDPRQAYGAMADDMAVAIRKFRDMKGKHVYFTSKIKRVVDEATGVTNFMPSVPGQQLLQSLPFFFDEVFVYRFKKVGEKVQRWLQTQGDLRFVAKDRSNQLDPMEKPDLTHIFNKISKQSGVQKLEDTNDSTSENS